METESCPFIREREPWGRDIEDAIAHTRNLSDGKKKEFLELDKCDGYSDIPHKLKEQHLSCLKTFQMFFDSGNLFDSRTALFQSINKAIYEPLATNSSPNPHELEKRVDNGFHIKTNRTAPQAKLAFGIPSTRKISMYTRPLSCIASMQPRFGMLSTLWF